MKMLREAPICESTLENKNGKFIVSGVFSRAEAVNKNHRIYSRGLWESILGDDSIKDQIKNRQMLGELGHPDKVETTLKDVSHVITSLVLRPNNEVWGEAEILDTPSGRILKTLYEANVKIGISSRGYVEDNFESQPRSTGGNIVVPNSYKLVGFDFVLNPSTEGAFPEIGEETKNEIKSIMTEDTENKLSDDLKQTLEEMVSHKEYDSLHSSANLDSVTLSFNSAQEAKYAISLSESKEISGVVNISRAGKNVDYLVGEDYSSQFIASKLNMLMRTNNLNPKITYIEEDKEHNFKSILEEAALKVENKKEGEENMNEDAINDKDALELLLAERKRTLELEDEVKKLKCSLSLAEDFGKKLQDSSKEVNESFEKAVLIIEELRSRYLKAEEIIEAKMDDSNVSELAEAVAEDLKARYLTAEAVIAELRDMTNAYKDDVDEKELVLSKAIEVIEEFRDKVNESENVYISKRVENVITSLRDRCIHSGKVITNLKDRYLMAEKIINDLKNRYLSVESSNTIGTSFNEESKISKNEFLTEATVKYSISPKEASRIFEGVGSVKAFNFVMEERKKAALAMRAGLPLNGVEKIDESIPDSKIYSDEENKMAVLLTRAFS